MGDVVNRFFWRRRRRVLFSGVLFLLRSSISGERSIRVLLFNFIIAGFEPIITLLVFFLIILLLA